MKIMMQSTDPRKPGVTSSEAKVVCNYVCTSHGFICNQETFGSFHDWSVQAAGRMQVIPG